MGPRERLILILLSLALAGGLAALVVAKGREDEARNAPKGSVGPEGWDLRRVPSYGAPLREETLASGVVVQTVEEGEGDPIPPDHPVDVHYRIFTLDGQQRGRGVWPKVKLGSKRPLPTGVLEGLAGVRLFEKRRLFVRAPETRAGPPRTLPPGMDAVFDLRPVELVIDDTLEGTGRKAELNKRIRFHYVGRLEDGTVFESSHERGRPGESLLVDGALIKGWLEGIPGMRVGGKRRLWIPFHLAYGGRSPAHNIPPYSNLIFDIELLHVGG